MSQLPNARFEDSGLTELHLSHLDQTELTDLLEHPSQEGASLLPTHGSGGAPVIRQTGHCLPGVSGSGVNNGTLPLVPTTDNSLPNQETSNEGRNTNENDLAINNPQPYDEEIYLFILQSDDPVWDYLYCRIRRLEEKRGNMTAMEVSELHFLRNMDADLRWGRFLGGEIPGRIFLRSQFYRDILDPRITALISRSWSEDEVLQHDDPVKFYLIWRSKKQLREERWAEHWDLDPNAIVQIPELDEIIRNLPDHETSRFLKKNTKAYQCCSQLLTNLRESDEVLYEPEIRYLKKLLGKFEFSRLWSLLPPIALAGNAICFFVSIAENKPVAEGHFCQSNSTTSSTLATLFLAGSTILLCRSIDIISGRQRAEHWSQYALLGLASTAGYISFGLRRN